MLSFPAEGAYRRKPDVSVVVVVYNIPLEAPRTLFSLSAAYQRNIHPDDYEVIVIDNGSIPPLDRNVLEGLAGNFRLIRINPASPSPAHALNRGIAEAKGEIIGIMIDGARIVTPGLIHFARHGGPAARPGGGGNARLVSWLRLSELGDAGRISPIARRSGSVTPRSCHRRRPATAAAVSPGCFDRRSCG